MNFKTTLALAAAVLVLAVAYLLWGRPSPAEQTADDDNAAAAKVEEEKSGLPKPPFGQDTSITRVEWKLRNQPGMVFERIDEEKDTAGVGEWQMLEPVRCVATGYRINDLVSTVKGLKLVSKLRVGASGGITLEDAGLRPEPAARLAATSGEEKTFVIELGRPLLGQNKTYVHLPEHAQEIFIADGDFRSILDTPATQYRELKLFRVTTANAVELEVTERLGDRTTTYQLKKQDGDWVFTSPFKAKADQKKIRDVVNAMNIARAFAWLDDIPSNLAEFGLDAPHLHVKLVTEEQVEKPKPKEEEAEKDSEAEKQDEAKDEAPEKEVKRQEFVLLISDRKPIDEDKQVYAKRGDDQQVGTVLVVERDKFTPKPSEWRDMKICQAAATQANSLSIKLPNESIALELRGREWYFAGSDERAESPEVTDLLSALDALKAVSFVDEQPEASLGLDPAAAEITLALADQPGQEIIRVGAFTEEVDRRLRYVQRVGAAAVAKARSGDLEKLLRNSRVYRNREIMDFEETRIQKIELSRLLPASGRMQVLTLTRDENKVWQMTSPAQAAVDLKPVNELVAKLAKLRGRRIVDEVDPAKLSLLKPNIQLAITIEGVPTIKTSDSADPAAPPETIPGEPIIRQVNLAKYEGAVHAHRLDRPGFMELDSAVYDALMAELLPGEIWSFEPSQVVAFGSTTTERSVQFKLQGERWRYSAEPDLPIDAKKVQEHLKKLRGVQTFRFVEYAGTNLTDYGLDAPTHRFFLELEGGERRELLISGMPYRGEGTNYYAALADGNRIFVLPPAILDLVGLKLELFESAK